MWGKGMGGFFDDLLVKDVLMEWIGRVLNVKNVGTYGVWFIYYK